MCVYVWGISRFTLNYYLYQWISQTIQVEKCLRTWNNLTLNSEQVKHKRVKCVNQMVKVNNISTQRKRKERTKINFSRVSQLVCILFLLRWVCLHSSIRQPTWTLQATVFGLLHQHPFKCQGSLHSEHS